MKNRFQFRTWVTPANLVRAAADTVMIQLALIAALAVRFFWLAAFQNPKDLSASFWQYVGWYQVTAIPLNALCLAIFMVSGFYSYGRYYRGRHKFPVVAMAVTFSFVIYGFFIYFFDVYEGELKFARRAFLLAWFFTVLFIGGSRFWVKLWQHTVQPESDAIARQRARSDGPVLVIGGGGYIGSALVPMLLESGRSVRVLDLMIYGDKPLSSVIGHPKLEILRGDFRHVENVAPAMRNVQSVIHLGGIVGDPACNIDEDLTIDINLSATRMVAEFAKNSGVDRFVFASTCSVYGACDDVLDESSPVRPVGIYGHTKQASEKLLLQMGDSWFAPTILRFATIYGLSGRTRFDLVVNLLAAKAKIDGQITIFNGKQWRPFVHVQDAARAVLMSLQADLQLVGGEILNVGSDAQNYTIEQIGQLVQQQVIAAEMITSEDDQDPRNYRVDFCKIADRLGFEPQWTVETGIQQVLEAIASGQVKDYRDPQYSNVDFLTQAGTSELDRDRWARDLMKDLAER